MLSENMGQRVNQYVKDYVVFDLETTGVSSKYDQVIEISAVKVMNEEVVDEFSTLVNPQRPIPFAASNVNGITDAMVKDAPVFKDALEAFFAFVGDMTLVGHNIHSFDMKFIYRDAQLYFGKVPDNDYVDTYLLAKTYLPELKHRKLVDLAAKYGISPDGAHRALNDCRMNQQVYFYLSKEMEPQKLQESGARICPRCNGVLKKRNGRFGEFWGCSSFPQCRYTEN